MASGPKLDAPRRARTYACGIIFFALVFVQVSWLQVSCLAKRRPLRKAAATNSAQEFSSEAARLAAAQKAFDAGQYEDAARLARGSSDPSADLDFVAGLSLAKLQRWGDGRGALEAGHRKSLGEARFLVELAGVDYKLKDFRSAKRELRAALKLDPRDSYTREFLGTLYFLESNLEATLNYWNAVDKPRLRAVDFVPAPKLRRELLARAIT